MKTEQIKYIWEVSHGQRGRILLSCLTGIIGVAVSLAFIYASKVVIDIATGATIGSLPNAAILTIALLIAQLLCKWKLETHCATAYSPVYYKAVGTNWNASTPAIS